MILLKAEKRVPCRILEGKTQSMLRHKNSGRKVRQTRSWVFLPIHLFWAVPLALNGFWFGASFALAQEFFPRFEWEFWAERGMEYGNPITNPRFRVNAPEAVLHPVFGRRSETRSSGMLQVEFPLPLFDLKGCQLYVEAWGGHPKTGNKRVTINGRSTYYFPKVGVEEGHCTHEYPVFDLKLTDLVTGYNAIQFACDQGESFWGHFIVDELCLRAILDRDHPAVRRAGLDSFRARVFAQWDSEKELFRIALDLQEGDASRVARVDFYGFYEGYDENGNLQSRDWHGFTRRRQPVGIIGSTTEAPWEVIWDVSMLPAQEDVAIQAVVRFSDPPGLQYRTEIWSGLRIPDRENVRVAFYPAREIPVPFWSRAGKPEECIIPVDIPPEQMERVELHVVTWASDPENKDFFTLNGQSLEIPLADHRVEYAKVQVNPRFVRAGENVVRILAKTEHHGVEVLRPGPMLAIRYRTQ